MELQMDIDDDLLNELKRITGLNDVDAICDLALREMIEERNRQHSLLEHPEC